MCSIWNNNISVVIHIIFIYLFVPFSLPSHPGYFGKVGMRYFRLVRNHYYCPTVNVEKLWSLIPQKVSGEAEKKKEEGKYPVLDVLKYVREGERDGGKEIAGRIRLF